MGIVSSPVGNTTKRNIYLMMQFIKQYLHLLVTPHTHTHIYIIMQLAHLFKKIYVNCICLFNNTGFNIKGPIIFESQEHSTASKTAQKTTYK